MKLLMIVFLLIAGGAGAGYGQAKAAGGVAGTQTPAGAHVKERSEPGLLAVMATTLRLRSILAHARDLLDLWRLADY